MNRSTFLYLSISLVLSGCARERGQHHAHDDHAPGPSHHGSPHGHHGEGPDAPQTMTSWGERTQLFIARPSLVAGQRDTITAVLTALHDHSAIDTGIVTIELAGGEHAAESFTVEAPTSDGIFTTEIQPEHPGPRRVTLRVDTIAFSEVHDLGEFEVFTSPGEALAMAPRGHDEHDEIAYPLERQWRVPFRVAQATSRPMRPNVPAFARLSLPTESAETAEKRSLVLTVDVPETYAPRIREVSGAWFRVDGVPEAVEVPGEALIEVGEQVDARTRTLPVRFRIDDAPRGLFPGVMVRAHLIVDAPRQATAAPRSAVIDDSGADVVYVQTGGQSFERRAVRLGVRDGDLVEITDGVSPGEWVVAEGGYGVKIAAMSTESVGHGHAH